MMDHLGTTTKPTTNAYAQALRDYIAGRSESTLLQAYEIGRRCSMEPNGLLDLIGLHTRALRQVMDGQRFGKHEDAGNIVEAAGEFLQNAIVPHVKTAWPSRDEAHASPDGLILQLISMLCYEVRGPLTAVLASAGMLQELLEPQWRRERELVSNVLDGGNRIRTRTDELMDIVGFESGAVSLDRWPIDAGTLMTQIARRAEPTVTEAGLAFHWQGPKEGAGSFLIDAARFDQTVAHLVHNAVHFGAGGGRVDVLGRVEEALIVEVRDYGPGIPPALRSSLFRPFARSPQARRDPGLGVGLALCHNIVRAHGGHISLAEVEGQGTLVRIVVPPALEVSPRRGEPG